MIWRPLIKDQTFASDPVRITWEREAATIADDITAEAASAPVTSPVLRRDFGIFIVEVNRFLIPLSNR